MPGDVQITGTVTEFASKAGMDDAGGTAIQNDIVDADHDAANGTLTDASFFQELTLFIGEIAAAKTLEPMVVIARINEMTTDMMRDRSM